MLFAKCWPCCRVLNVVTLLVKAQPHHTWLSILDNIFKSIPFYEWWLMTLSSLQGVQLIMAWWCHMGTQIWINMSLAQVMVCCLMAPSHYLNQCWQIIRGALWHSTEEILKISVFDMSLKITNLRLHIFLYWCIDIQDSTYQEIFICLTQQNFAFFNRDYIWFRILEENFVQIHLANWQFY